MTGLDPSTLFPLFADLLDLPAMTLATTGTNGDVFAAALYFAASRDLHFYFFSKSDSQHGQNLETNPRAAVTISTAPEDYNDIHGLQLRGRAADVSPGAEWQSGWSLYAAKFPFVVGLGIALARNKLFCFEPAWIRLIDNRRGFGFKQEWNLVHE